MLQSTIQGGGNLVLLYHEQCPIAVLSSTTLFDELSLRSRGVSSSNQPLHHCQTDLCLLSHREAQYQRLQRDQEARATAMRRSNWTPPPLWQPPLLTIIVTSSVSAQVLGLPPTVGVEVLLQLQLRLCSCLE